MIQVQHIINGYKVETIIIQDTAVESFCEGKEVISIKRLTD